MSETGIWIRVIVVLVLMTVTGLGLRWVNMRVDREVLETSHQYHEARKMELVTYDAQMAELRAQLDNPELTDGQRADLEAQMASIRVLLRAAESRQ